MRKYLILIITLFISNTVFSADSLLTIKQHLDRLQREVSDLSETVFSDKQNLNSSINNKNIPTNDLTAFDLRIYDLEKDIKSLNENFEELIFQLDDLKNLLEDLDLKIENNLEKNTNLDSTTNKNNLNDKIQDSNTLGNLIIKTEEISDLENTENSNENIYETKITLNPEEDFQNAFDLIRSQRFNKAKEALLMFIKNHGEHKLSGSAHYWLGEIYLLKKDYREAALILAEGYQNFPKSLKAEDMLYKLAEALENIGKKEDSCNTLQKIENDFPKSKLKNKIQSKLISLECSQQYE